MKFPKKEHILCFKGQKIKLKKLMFLSKPTHILAQYIKYQKLKSQHNTPH